MPDNDCNCRAGQQHGSTVGAAAPAALAGVGVGSEVKTKPECAN